MRAADVVVAGAGPAGALAALTLARGGARVVLVDRETFPRHKLCGDTLNPGAMALLEQMGLAGPVATEGLPLDGMLVTGGTGVAIDGRYGDGLVGRAWPRARLDAHLLAAAAAAGVDVRTGVHVVSPHLHDGRVDGVVTRDAAGRRSTIGARWTVAADGRRSPLGLALGLVSHPRTPRRWAVGTYAEGVEGLGRRGEMHVRDGYYIGVAPAEGGLANLCLVTADRTGMGDPGARLWSLVRHDPVLRERCRAARQVAPAVTLGPLAVDASGVGVPGLLLAGDAAGFVDPMTGDGLHLALRGGALAAEAILSAGASVDARVLGQLAAARREAFGAKLRFNRALRALVGSPMGVRLGALGASLAPAVLRLVIATAGDVSRARARAA
ncbi:oxidoreductase [Luteitalea sp. TBR-22]|uniref:NAD(P)/FAD-dependent oxidoreductase n=1 Tax=Luteitalea sp. TBR-22 TaxID=2802971 RepID=UPI001AFB2504|nr:NAD(P)/FAD-dependent oxidoreductase [Luteitalea sp. TBR-22]BCS32890.1 oxidoreductase [Luteitalea sp. TBR-22]